MNANSTSEPGNPLEDSEERAREIVHKFLDASMIPDPDGAMSYMSPDVLITFTGGRKFPHPREIAEFNGRRYGLVSKRMDRFDVIPGNEGTVVYCIGVLSGKWPDGQPFEDNRFIDRFVVRDGLIVKMDVWNDSAERLLERERPDL